MARIVNKSLNIKQLCYLRILVLGLLVSSFPVYAEDSTTVHFVEEASWPPFTPDKSGYVEEGLSWALISEVFARVGLAVDLELVPQLRMLRYLKTGHKDGVTVISKNPERAEYLEYSDPIFQKRGRVYYLMSRETPFEWRRYEDLAGLRIGVVHGHSYGEAFMNAHKVHNFHLDEANTVEQNFDKLIFRRVDIILCNEITAKQYLRLDRYRDRITSARKSYYEKNYHIAFSKHSKFKGLLKKVNEAIRAMKVEGRLQSIIEEYSYP